MKSLNLASMAAIAILGATAAVPSSERYYAEDRPKPRIKPKAPPCNHEMHIKLAVEKRARKATKFREIQERQERKSNTQTENENAKAFKVLNNGRCSPS